MKIFTADIVTGLSRIIEKDTGMTDDDLRVTEVSEAEHGDNLGSTIKRIFGISAKTNKTENK